MNMDDDHLEEYPALIWLTGGDGRRDGCTRAEEIEVSTL